MNIRKRIVKSRRMKYMIAEGILLMLVVLVIILMLQDKRRNQGPKIAVVIQDSDDGQWAAFRYGLQMAASDYGVRMSVVSLERVMSMEEGRHTVEYASMNGADAVIMQSSLSFDTSVEIYPFTEPDHKQLGNTLAEELLKDYSGKLDGKRIGILLDTFSFGAASPYREETQLDGWNFGGYRERERGFLDRIAGLGAEISWAVSGNFQANPSRFLEKMDKVDIVVALDDASTTAAGECLESNLLHGAVLYGIANSMKAVSYLDNGLAQCLVTPDDFRAGYYSLARVAENLQHRGRLEKEPEIRCTVLRAGSLFSEENKNLLFAMSQETVIP